MPSTDPPSEGPGFAVANRQSPAAAPRELVSRFRDRRFLAGLCGLLVISNAVTPWLVARALHREQIVLVADSGGNMIIAPGLDFKEASKIHTTCGLLAAQALLQRGPAGFDMPDMVDNLFFRAARKKAQEEITQALPALGSRSMHQKVEISGIDVKSVRRTQGIQIYFIEVAGQIIRDGQISGARVREVDEVKLLFEMWRNPRLTENGRYPLVAADYQYLLLKPTGDRRREEDAPEPSATAQ